MNDDITLDDEDAEGSGYEESRDLESSGSGYGPDDEDAAHGSGLFVSKCPKDKKVDVMITNEVEKEFEAKL